MSNLLPNVVKFFEKYNATSMIIGVPSGAITGLYYVYDNRLKPGNTTNYQLIDYGMTNKQVKFYNFIGLNFGLCMGALGGYISVLYAPITVPVFYYMTYVKDRK